MYTLLVEFNCVSQLPYKKDDERTDDGRLKKELCEEFETEEWSKPYNDMDELFYDLGLTE